MFLKTLAACLMALSIYSLGQAILNFAFSRKTARHNPEWSYQNKEICKKTYKVNLYNGIFLLISSLVLLFIS